MKYTLRFTPKAMMDLAEIKIFIAFYLLLKMHRSEFFASSMVLA